MERPPDHKAFIGDLIEFSLLVGCRSLMEWVDIATTMKTGRGSLTPAMRAAIEF